MYVDLAPYLSSREIQGQNTHPVILTMLLIIHIRKDWRPFLYQSSILTSNTVKRSPFQSLKFMIVHYYLDMLLNRKNSKHTQVKSFLLKSIKAIFPSPRFKGKKAWLSHKNVGLHPRGLIVICLVGDGDSWLVTSIPNFW